MRHSLFGFTALMILALLSSACGRPASDADCQLIVDRLVELELRAANTTDSAVIAKKQEEVRAQMKDRMHDCVGRRVTDGMMSCVKQASRPDDVLECIR